jgi:hypothetical protein
MAFRTDMMNRIKEAAAKL